MKITEDDIKKWEADKEIKILIEILEKNSPYLSKMDEIEIVNLRKASAKALGRIGESSAILPLIKSISSNVMPSISYESMRLTNAFNSTISTALANIGRLAVESLIHALRNKDENIRRYVARSLGEIKDKRAVGPLIKTLKDKDYETQGEATKSLGKIKDRRAIEPLVELMRKDSHASYWVEDALKRLDYTPSEIKKEGLQVYVLSNIRDANIAKKFVNGFLKTKNKPASALSIMAYERKGKTIIEAKDKNENNVDIEKSNKYYILFVTSGVLIQLKNNTRIWDRVFKVDDSYRNRSDIDTMSLMLIAAECVE